MPHVVVAGKIHEAGVALLKAAPGITFDLVNEVTKEAYAPLMPKADALLLRTQPLTADVIATSNQLKIVSRHGVGYDAVDVAALSARKIPLAIVGDVNSRAVAEHTLALMLAVARRVVAHDQASRSGNWNERNKFDSVELDGKKLLVIGYGRIGRRVGELARAFGMEVIAYDPFITDGSTMADLKAALAQADYVSLHMPAAKGAVIGAEELALMKPTAIIINAARGGLVDEASLDQALRARKIYGAGLDVLVEEPPKADHPLLSNPYLTISPHNAGLTQECAKRMAIAAAQNILDHFAGKLDPKLVVNS
ncbi:hydroxyacid dehydrogenase [Aestuariivirga litoralis]|uniref:hydroxyacid dehydrogenase n=1 Tax=Aestuariivirga litoralis TaxID=2650924 RepID=UPI0018C6672F|nr:hydroxyacid dehydrogenase [Aestuariivirga litoralis]MBG1232692.1 hydroxyacid dehydrogenase [Aestuariivirga litoralis]